MIIFSCVGATSKKRILTNYSLLYFACRTRTYGRGKGVGRALGDGFDRGDGVGLGVAVGVAVAVAVAVGVGVGVAPAEGPWIATIMGEPVLKNPTVALASSGG